jgi:hypothetical protein
VVIDFGLKVSPEHIWLNVPQAGMRSQALNIVWYKTATNQVVSFGETEEEVQPNYQRDETSGASQLSRQALFTPSSELLFEEMFLEYQTFRTHMMIRPSAVLQWLTWFGGIDSFNFELTIAGYDSWPFNKCLNLQYLLQTTQKAVTLRINGQSVEIPLWKRRVEKGIRSILTWAGPYAMIITMLFNLEVTDPVNFILGLLAILLLAVFASRLGPILWAAIMRDFVPRSYLRFLVTRKSSGVSSGLMARILADGENSS